MGWVVYAMPRPLHPGKDPVPMVQETGWAPGPVWTGAKNLAHLHTGFDSRTVQPVASRYTGWAIPAPELYIFVSFAGVWPICLYVLWNQKAAFTHSRHCSAFSHSSVTSDILTSRRYRILQANGGKLFQDVCLSGSLPTWLLNPLVLEPSV